MEDKEELLQKIAELEEKISQLERDLVHDKLTSLKTRAFFEEKSEKYLSLSKKFSDKRKDFLSFADFSLILFDIDYFKKINDTYGHLTGDDVLKNVAKTIESNVRVGDIVARWGGEEIAVFLLGANIEDAKNKAEEIRQAVEDLVFDKNPDLKVTISGGIAGFDKDLNQKAVLDRADKALYKAKESGRNKIIVYS